ncbi:PAN2-PAN3 deadenylation complex catalytic subunit PAN2-like [Ornithodoros turicata]|uniref:PAN2-PAN3 deadenylation complex catalytic subunit PAN2-like n=1 Tax=Ornithodoros turicata TaxID=34597 RepID=UPI003139CE11
MMEEHTVVPGQDYCFLQNVLVDGGSQFGVSALAFDSHEELLWMGNQGGHVTSYYTSELQKYTSFQIHATEEVRQVCTVEAGLLSLTSHALRLSNRRGLTVFHHTSEEFADMHCMAALSGDRLLAGGNQESLVELDLTRGSIVSSAPCPGGCAVIRRHPRFICCADFTGKVSLRDPVTMKEENSLESLSGTGLLSDFDVQGNMVVTCGFTNRHGALAVDMFIKVYDLRVMRAVTPIQMMFPPSLLRFVPAFTSRLFVVSQTGQFQLVDTSSASQSSYIYQMETAGTRVLCFDTSSSCQCLAFGDATGYLHLYGASSHVSFNNFSNPTEFADPEEPFHPIDINDEIAALASIPMPYCSSRLVSDLPKKLTKYVYRKPVPVDPVILSSMKMVGSVGYAPNPGLWRRNEVRYPRETSSSKETREDADIIPQLYKKIDVKYSRMGIEDFDFNLYNRTCFAGLETNLPNAYCNNMIQVLYFIAPLRCAVMNHTCQREFCLACELGFLFHMLDTAQGIPCQASNFLRAFRTIPEASALGLILSDSDDARKKVNFPRLVQSWTRFVLQQIHSETLGVVDEEAQKTEKTTEMESPVSKLFGWTLINSNQCRCGSVRQKESTTLLCSLVYPPVPEKGISQYPFTAILERSLCLESSMPTWCEKCEKYQPTLQSKRLKSLPDILTISSGLENQQDLSFWQAQVELFGSKEQKGNFRNAPVAKRCRYGNCCSRPGCKFFHDRDKTKRYTQIDASLHTTASSWLPLSIRIKLDEDGVVSIARADCKDNEDDKEEADDSLYELVAVVSVVNNTRSNIVSCVRVGPSYHLRHQGGAAVHWYLFNDFTILPITPEEAVWLPLDWKLPCVLYYSLAKLNAKHNSSVKVPLTADVFLQDVSLVSRSGPSHVTFTPLTPDEMLGQGDIVAMDAEFVTLNQEEAEIRSDGTRSTIRPSHMSVARISCLRGQGMLEGVPFIDDYISTQEQVVDYLTQFSGIQPGDLDVTISSKHLTTLKSTYQKLRYLVDEGVIFVGHGLKNDFRVINLVVPPEQVIDTVLLFQLPNKRMVSLRFLAWHFLGLKIQSKMHDSIEDAKTALRLYRKYQQLDQEGRVTEALKEMYEAGRSLSWKVPGTEED